MTVEEARAHISKVCRTDIGNVSDLIFEDDASMGFIVAMTSKNEDSGIVKSYNMRWVVSKETGECAPDISLFF